MSDLVQYLETLQKPVSRELLQNFESVQQYARSIFKQIDVLSQERHNRLYNPQQHAEEVSALCARLLPKHRLGELDEQINCVEVLVLLAGAWLHEIGLAESGAEEAYNVHSARWVWDEEMGSTRVAGLDPGLAAAVAHVCRAHRDHTRTGEVVSTLNPSQLQNMHWKNYRIRVPVLAAILRTAFLLEVFYHRRAADLGPNTPPEIARFWVEKGAISAFAIEEERGIIMVRLSENANSSEWLRQAAQRWSEHVNREFAERAMALLAEFKLAYREKLVTLPQPDAPEKATEGDKSAQALDLFRQDTAHVIARRNELGGWELKTSGDLFPLLQRTLIDERGRVIELQIAPGVHYPSEPPTAKSVPRIARLQFQNSGLYEGSAIYHWKEAIVRGSASALVELCEELRRFESAEQTFAAHAQALPREPRNWVLTESKGNLSVRLTRVLTTGQMTRTISLLTHPSYPLWPPTIEGLKELEAVSGRTIGSADALVERWRVSMDSGNPLEVFLNWLDSRITEIEQALRSRNGA